MSAPGRQEGSARLAAAATGLWLALWQVALAAMLLRQSAATTQAFFALTAAWLLGGFIGARWLPSGLLVVAVGAGVAARLLCGAAPFSPLAEAALLLAGALGGTYAGAFIGRAATGWADAARFLLLENNGFVLGYALAFALLMTHGPWLDAAALALGLGLLLFERGPQARLCGLLAGLASLYYLSAPYVGDRGWDGLMTATVLAHPDWVTRREVLFFAHPLVIPLTAPLFWLGLDPLTAAQVREALCAGGVVAVSGLAAAALAGTRRAAALAALLLTAAVWRFRLATCGEEKEAALLAGFAFLFLYLDHRGQWDLGLGGWRQRGVGFRRAVLALLLALSVGVHLLNLALGPVVLVDALLSRGAAERARARREAAWVLGGAALLAGPFLLWLAIGPGGARSLGEVLRYYFEYHLSGEFVSLPAPTVAALGERARAVFESGQRWLLGTPESAPLPGGLRVLLALGVAAALLRPLLAPREQGGSPAARRLLGFVLVHLLHAACFDLTNPESIAPAMSGLCVLVAGGLGRPAWPRLRALAAGSAVLGCLYAHGRAVAQTRAAAAPARAYFDRAAPSPAPLADLSQLLDTELPREALILVSERLHASYFHLYTRRRPLVVPYLDHSRESLRRELGLTTLSVRVYAPWLDGAGVRAAIAAGRPVYLLSGEPQPGLVGRPLPWNGLQLYTLAGPAAP